MEYLHLYEEHTNKYYLAFTKEELVVILDGLAGYEDKLGEEKRFDQLNILKKVKLKIKDSIGEDDETDEPMFPEFPY